MGADAAIRAAVAADAAAIAAVYNQGIEDRVATFETRLRAPEEVAQWLGDPLLVAERDGELLGFARVGPFSEREVYATVGKHGVYVARHARGQMLGRRLLEALAAAAEAAGFHKLTSGVFSENAASLAAHRAAGFHEVGVQRRHGRLDGRWRDVILVERLIGPAARP
ncbi:MAG: N-acetyltransferase [Solirubrobacteraceae bacterium]|nr:N-acetyltransferase [Solirubrobacteraceae bacterium]